MHSSKVLFFDLDGTLTDPKEGITKSIRFALEKMGLPAPPPDELMRFIGPSLRDSFAELIGADKAEAALSLYRQRYDTEGMGMIENIIYPKTLSVLTALKAQGKMLFVVTAKAHPIARKIIHHFGLGHFFQNIYGSEMDGTRSDKGDLIAYILEQKKFRPNDIIMIGDRKYDILGAARHDIRSIGVTWGYGSLEELQAAGASAIAHDPDELLTILLPPAN